MVGENEPWTRDGWVCEPRDQQPVPLSIPPTIELGEN
jgi:hypothetical protein